MSWRTRVVGELIGQLDAEELWKVSGKAIQVMQSGRTSAERSANLLRFLEDHLAGLLSGVEREDRIQLMNALLPLLAREFPLSALDVWGLSLGEE